MGTEQQMSYALIIGSSHYNTLGVLRSLGEKGVVCIFLCVEPKSRFVSKSKYIIKYYECSFAGIQDAVTRIISENKGKCVIFPTGDRVLLHVSKIDFLGADVVCPKSKIAVEKLFDKYYLSELARIAGLDVPEQKVFDWSEPITWGKYPAIIKPLKSIHGKKADTRCVTMIQN